MSNKSQKKKSKSGVRQPIAAKQSQTTTKADQPVASKIAQPVKGKNGNGTAAVANVISSDRYAYVNKDLINIGIIAGSLIIVLIILTFILR